MNLMRRLLLLLVLVGAGVLIPKPALAQDLVQIFGGYSYLRPSVNVTPNYGTCPLGELPPCPSPTPFNIHPNLNGWEISATINAYRWLGVTADFSGHYGSNQGSSIHHQTYLFGPQVHLPGPVSPFAHVLIGAAHESIGSAPEGFVAGSATAFAAAIGAGIDIKIVPFVSFRPIQLDYVVTRFGSATQNQPRASAGLMIHF
jgi:hypothetical protein